MHCRQKGKLFCRMAVELQVASGEVFEPAILILTICFGKKSLPDAIEGLERLSGGYQQYSTTMAFIAHVRSPSNKGGYISTYHRYLSHPEIGRCTECCDVEESRLKLSILRSYDPC